MGIFNFFGRKGKPKEIIGEHKKVPRWQICAPAKIRWAGKSDYVPCEVKDLSLKGCCLVMEEAIPSFPLQAELYFNENFFFHVEMSVVWDEKSDFKKIYGIKFSRIKDADKEKIFQMIKNNFPHIIAKHWWQE